MTTPAMDAALSGAVVTDFVAVEVILPFKTLRLLDGGSMVTFPVADPETGVAVNRTFTGEDDTYGVLSGMEGVTEGLGTSAPKMRVVIRPPTLAASAQLNLPGNQGSLFRLWYGCVEQVTGAVVLYPEMLFWGWLDQPRYVGGKDTVPGVEYDVASAMELLFAAEEGQRLNHAFHTRVFPGELGLQYVTEVERQLPWGVDTARSPMISATDGGYSSGGGGGGTGTGGGSGGGGGGGGTAPFPGGSMLSYLVWRARQNQSV